MANQDFGIIITQTGTSTTGAPVSQQILNTSFPVLKIDTQNPAANQTIEFIITTDPPEPTSPSYATTYTLIYKFKHGYNYIPAIESLFYIQTPPPGANYSQTYFLDDGFLSRMSIDDGAILYAEADNTWVYYVIEKFNDGSGSPNPLTGTNVLATTHIYLDGIGV